MADKRANAAQRAIAAIRESGAILELHPTADRPVSDMEPEFREWLI